MERFIIKGGRRLEGEIRVNGAKNAALPILAGTVLTEKPCVISNIPLIEDVLRQIELLKKIGANIERTREKTYRVWVKDIATTHLDQEISQKLKASILISAGLLAREGESFFPHPGGCVIGQRPRDIFLSGFERFGAKIIPVKNGYCLKAKKIKGTKFVFPIISVTATEAMIILSVFAKGRSVLINCACEPEVVNLISFLNKCGAKIKGAGTHTICIDGVSKLNGANCRIIPDRIEAGSFAILAGATKSRIKISGIIPEHLEVFLEILKKAGVNFKTGSNYLEVIPPFKLKAVNIKTKEYPGFPTDLQPPFTVLLTQAHGDSLVQEVIFEGRLFYTDILNQMGANILMCDPHRVLVRGPTKLYGRKLISPDIRAGIALIIAGLLASGRSEIENIYQIDRGYEEIEQRLSKIGADIRRVRDN
ncbi:UDP-N-acetylglucosamine 1-carboxyvinyltransferase [bacterium]|nr:UDP-N-acetylglucosamine 1-carboxyvinyltransferase [bacterium]